MVEVFCVYKFSLRLLCHNLPDNGGSVAEDDVGDDGFSCWQVIADVAPLQVVVIYAYNVVIEGRSCPVIFKWKDWPYLVNSCANAFWIRFYKRGLRREIVVVEQFETRSIGILILFLVSSSI